MVNVLLTYSAPAERASTAEVAADHQKLLQEPLVQQLLDSFPEPAMILNPQRQVVLASDKLAALPPNATADHTAAAPGDQVQFSTTATVTGPGVCPQFVTGGVWTTSDAVNTAISNQPATQGLATCLNATPSPATITYTGTIFGVRFKPATLTCN